MNVFIGWSGRTGKELAEILKKWLGAMFPEIQFCNPGDLTIGSNWRSELRGGLTNADCGVFCLTREGLNSTWLAYEAGMLGQREPPVPVVTFLFGVNRAEIHGPFQHYQSFTPDEAGVRLLAQMLWNEAKENHVQMPDSFGLKARVELMSSAFQADLDALWETEKAENSQFNRQEKTAAEISDINKKLDAILSALPALATPSDSSAEDRQAALNRPS